MAQSKSTKKLFNMAYGLGASIVIIGALFKILHWDFGFPFDGKGGLLTDEGPVLLFNVWFANVGFDEDRL